MRELIATMTSKGQLTVPVEVRRTLGLKQGDKVVFQVEGQEVKLAPITSRLVAGYQSIPALSSPQTWEEIEEAVATERAQAYSQQLREARA